MRTSPQFLDLLTTQVLTVRGRTGAVVAMLPLSTESTEAVVTALSEYLPARALEQVRFVYTDAPSAAFWTGLKATPHTADFTSSSSRP